MTLTPSAVEAALYVTSPVGRSGLVAHLEQRGYEVTGDTLTRTVAQLGEKVEVVTVQIGQSAVPLWCLRGNKVA